MLSLKAIDGALVNLLNTEKSTITFVELASVIHFFMSRRIVTYSTIQISSD